jgi:hypothetical protein
MEIITFVGPGAIVLGWLFQLASAQKGVKEVQTSFIVAYTIGVAALVADGFTSGQFLPAALNSLALILSALVLFQTKLNKKK